MWGGNAGNIRYLGGSEEVVVKVSGDGFKLSMIFYCAGLGWMVVLGFQSAERGKDCEACQLVGVRAIRL